MTVIDNVEYDYRDFKSKAGTSYKIAVPTYTVDIESFFVFSLPKSGSTLLNNIIRDICFDKNIPCIDITRDSYNYGIRPKDISTQDINSLIYDRGYAYIGFRRLFDISNLHKYRKILLVRDPKDVLVSLYFSHKYSHTVPNNDNATQLLNSRREKALNMEINAFVIEKSKIYSGLYEKYMNMQKENLKVYRYEDVIYEKVEWVNDMCIFLDIDIESSDIKNVVSKFDIIPAAEKLTAHIRQVHPENYKKHLTNETISFLNKQFDKISQAFGYV